MDSAWIGVVGALGGVLVTGLFGLVTVLVTHRWQDDTRQRERTDRLQESRATLRRDAYTRFLVASDLVADFLLAQPPLDEAEIPADEQGFRERLRELWAHDDSHVGEYSAALLHGRLLAGDRVAGALDEFDKWMTAQFALMVVSKEPLDNGAFGERDLQRKPLIDAMRAEQEADLLATA